MQNNNLSKGVYLAFLTALVSGFAVFLNKFAVSIWANSSVFTTAKNLVAAVFLISLLVLLKKIPELKNLNKKQWLQLVAIGFIGGSVPFLLFFKGLSLTSATGAAFIHKTLFIWVALLAIPFLKEKISSLQFLALGIIVAGVYLFSSPVEFHFGYGEILVLLATLLWAAENIIAKITLRDIPALMVGAGRMFFGSVFLLLYLLFTGDLGQLFIFGAVKTGWLFLSGIILFGYVVSWYSALKFVPATVVSSILVIAAPLTALLNSIFVTHNFRSSMILPAILILAGVLVLSRIPGRFAIFLLRKYPSWQGS